MEDSTNYLSMFFDITNYIQAIFAIFSLYGIWAFVRDWLPKKVKLSIGTFTIKRKYFDVQNVTNIVSAKYYDGGQVPANVRKEIIDLTCPKIKIRK